MDFAARGEQKDEMSGGVEFSTLSFSQSLKFVVAIGFATMAALFAFAAENIKNFLVRSSQSGLPGLFKGRG